MKWSGFKVHRYDIVHETSLKDELEKVLFWVLVNSVTPLPGYHTNTSTGLGYDDDNENFQNIFP